jgi:hypothetical protein
MAIDSKNIRSLKLFVNIVQKYILLNVGVHYICPAIGFFPCEE